MNTRCPSKSPVAILNLGSRVLDTGYQEIYMTVLRGIHESPISLKSFAATFVFFPGEGAKGWGGEGWGGGSNVL